MWALRILISVLVNIWIDNSDPSVVCISGNISKQLWQIKVTQIQYKRDHECDALNECQNNTTTTSYNNNDNNTNNNNKNNNISDWSWARHNKFYTHYGGSTVPEILLGYLPVLFSIGAWVISDFKLKVGSLLFPCHRQWITLYGCKHLNFSWTLWFRLCIWHPFSPLSSSQCGAHFLSHNLHLVFCDPLAQVSTCLCIWTCILYIHVQVFMQARVLFCIFGLRTKIKSWEIPRGKPPVQGPASCADCWAKV